MSLVYHNNKSIIPDSHNSGCVYHHQPQKLSKLTNLPRAALGKTVYRKLYFWQCGQKCVPRPATLVFLISVPQTGQGVPCLPNIRSFLVKLPLFPSVS